MKLYGAHGCLDAQGAQPVGHKGGDKKANIEEGTYDPTHNSLNQSVQPSSNAHNVGVSLTAFL